MKDNKQRGSKWTLKRYEALMEELGGMVDGGVAPPEVERSSSTTDSTSVVADHAAGGDAPGAGNSTAVEFEAGAKRFGQLRHTP